MSQIDEFYKKDIEYRTTMIARQEVAVLEWGKGLKQVPPGVLDGIDLPEEITLKAFMPALYQNPVDWEAYEEQYNSFTKLSAKINGICMKYNEEAVKCLFEHQQLISRKA